MKYLKITHGIFLCRHNRFVADVDIDGCTTRCHVKNTGRLGELLLPGAKVVLSRAENPNRSTKYDLIAVYNGGQLFNIDSQIPNKVFGEWVQKGNLFRRLTLLRPETRYGDARFDFYAEADGQKIFAEVKGVTLLQNGTALFPDAPTLRGLKHIHHLIACKQEGFDACLVFVLQMKGANCFSPNRKTQPAFAEALQKAHAAGVRIFAFDCTVTEDSITLDQQIKIVF